MRNIAIISIFFVSLQFGGPNVFSQDTRPAMTNADVVELIRAGVPESTIVLAIRKSDPDFDTSPKALIEMHKLGAGPGILDAMLKPDLPGSLPEDVSASDKRPNPQADDCAEGALPNEVIMIEGENRLLMKRSQTRRRFTGFGLFSGKAKSYIALEGIRSRLHITDSTPEFETSLPSDINAAEKLILVRLTVVSGRREVEVSRTSRAGSYEGIEKEAIVPTTFELVNTQTLANGKKYTLYHVKVVNPLPPGEYAFVPRSIVVDYYDFGVDTLTP